MIHDFDIIWYFSIATNLIKFIWLEILPAVFQNMRFIFRMIAMQLAQNKRYFCYFICTGFRRHRCVNMNRTDSDGSVRQFVVHWGFYLEEYFFWHVPISSEVIAYDLNGPNVANGFQILPFKTAVGWYIYLNFIIRRHIFKVIMDKKKNVFLWFGASFRKQIIIFS